VKDDNDFKQVEELLLLLKVYRVSNDGQTEIHAAEPLVPDPSHFVTKIAIAKKKCRNHQVVITFWQN
jgi:hypothetical protein